MGSPYLNNNESIILSTHNVVINAVPAEAILTNQRLIIVDARHTQLRPQDIPFAAIETVTIGDNSAMDPVLSISVVIKDETTAPARDHLHPASPGPGVPGSGMNGL